MHWRRSALERFFPESRDRLYCSITPSRRCMNLGDRFRVRRDSRLFAWCLATWETER